MSRISLREFTIKYLGKSVAVPWGYQGECVSLVQRYLNECHGVPFQRRGNAIDYGDNLLKNSLGYLVKTPKYGDIIVYGENYGGGLGHVVIYIDEKTIFDQNNITKRPTRTAQFRHMLKGHKQIIRMRTALKSDSHMYEDEVYAFTSKHRINLRTEPTTSAHIIKVLPEGTTYNYKMKYNDGNHVWVSDGKTWLAVRRVIDGKRQELWGELHEQELKVKDKGVLKLKRDAKYISKNKKYHGVSVPQRYINVPLKYELKYELGDGWVYLSELHSYVHVDDVLFT